MRRVVEIGLERPASGGAVGRLDDGRVAFIRHALPGETVLAEIDDEGARFVRGDAREVVRASPHRVEPPCSYAGPGRCGGCDLQHADATAQRDWKAFMVSEHLRRIAHLELEVNVTVPAHGARGSRTRLRCAVDAKGSLGLRRSRSHEVETLDACWLADPRLASAFDADWSDYVEVELRAIGAGDPFAVARRADGQTVACALSGSELAVSPASHVDVAGITYRVSPESFWQSHVDAPEVLGSSVERLAGLGEGDRVADLYAGVGLFGVRLARAGARVVSVEASVSACTDALHNLDGAPARVLAAAVTPELVGNVVSEDDVIVMDPPRAGLDRGVAASLVKAGVRRIVYVSCDAATFARDVHEFTRAGFALADLEVHDLFPMTEHVEVIGLLDSP